MRQALQDHLSQPVLKFSRKDFLVLDSQLSVGESIDFIRLRTLEEQLLYLYVKDKSDRLVGIVPLRRMLSSGAAVPVSAIMQERVTTLSEFATVRQACKLFASHNLLAIPVVSEDDRLLGVVDLTFFRRENLSFAQRQQANLTYQLIGLKPVNLLEQSLTKQLFQRARCLGIPLLNGVACILLASMIQTDPESLLSMMLFLLLLVSLASRFGIQYTYLAIQRFQYPFRLVNNNLSWIVQELIVTITISSTMALITGLVATFYVSYQLAFAIAESTLFSIMLTSLIGFYSPTLVYALRNDRTISAGIVTIFLSTVLTVLIVMIATSTAIQKSL